MMALSSAVSDMMALPYGASEREIDDDWLVAAHRILFRLDLTCSRRPVLPGPRGLPGAAASQASVTSMAARAGGNASSSRDKSPRLWPVLGRF